MIAPRDGMAQRLLPRWRIPCPTRQDGEPLAQPCEQRLGREQFATSCCQFNRQGQAIEADTNLSERTSVGTGQLERGLDGLGTLQEEGDGGIVRQGISRRKLREVRHGEGWDAEFVFSLDVQHCAAGHEHSEVWAPCKQVGQVWGCCQELLEIVKAEQEVLVSQEGGEDL